MNIPQEIIDAANVRHEGQGQDDDATFKIATWILRQAGELPPPEVRIPDCFLGDDWIAVDGDGTAYIYDVQPSFSREAWGVASNHESSLKLILSESLILPSFDWKESCWQVSKLRKMQAEFEKWQADHEQQPESEDEYIVWGIGELPEEFRNSYSTELEMESVCDVWVRGSSGDISNSSRYRMKRSDYERLRSKELTQPSISEDVKHGLEELKELLEHTSVEQLRKDHLVMEKMRKGYHLRRTEGKYQWISPSGMYGDIYQDPADGIPEVKGGE